MTRQASQYVAASILSLMIAGVACGSQILVPQDHPTIQAGMDAAQDGDTVLVGPGIYSGQGNVNIDFLKKSISLESQAGPELTVIDCNSARVSGVVMDDGKFNGNGTVVFSLKGFTIKNALGNGITIKNSSSPLIENCIIENNSGWHGGGIYCDGWNAPVIRNCIIRNNECTDGQWENGGGGLRCGHVTKPILENCAIYGNSAHKGGGISAGYFAKATLKNCLVYDNAAHTTGGGVNTYGSRATVELINCTVVDNKAKTGGGVFGSGDAEHPSVVRNCIVRDNKAAIDYALLKNELRGVPDASIASLEDIAGEYVEVSYSNTAGDRPGQGNFDLPPLFIDPDTDNYLLHGTSPCVDAGSPEDDYSLESAQNGRINVGAYGNTPQAAVYDTYPTIRAITPQHGLVSEDSIITVEGVHFGNDPTATELRLDDVTITEILSWQDTKIICRVRHAEAGLFHIVVSNAQGQTHVYPEPFRVYAEDMIEVSGDVSGTWLRGFTYVITGDTSVPDGNELTIEPGVSIIVAESEQKDPFRVIVDGSLYAMGTQNAPILFTRTDLSVEGGWEGLILRNQAILEYCEISHAKTGIRAQSDNTIISNCHIHDCSLNGLHWAAYGQNASGLVINTLVENNGKSGIRFESGDYIANGVASACTIRSNNEWGIYIEALADGNRSRASNPTIEYCQVNANGRGGLYLYANTRIGSGWVDRKNSSRVNPSIVGSSVFENDGPGISCYASGDYAEGSLSISRYAYTSPSIDRCVIYGNSLHGVQIQCDDKNSYAEPKITHCSVSTSGNSGISVSGRYAMVDLSNSIISTNQKNYFEIQEDASVVPTYSLFDGAGALPEGQGNLKGDPQWVDASHGNFSLVQTSPAIDSGSCPFEAPCLYHGQAPDIGAVEWQE